MFNFMNFGNAKQESLKLTKPWVKIIAKFPNFLDNKSRIYVIKPSTNAQDYNLEMQTALKKMIKNAYDAGQIASTKLENLLFIAETSLQNSVTGVMIVDRGIMNDYPDLAALLMSESIIEIVL